MTHTPHDALFKTVFSEPRRAAELLAHVLGPEVSARIDLTGLRVVDGSFIDADLSQSQVDLLYAATIMGRPGHIHLMLEHQSTAEWAMPLRLLRYMQRIWDRHIADDRAARTLPPILACVLHHSDAGWRAATNFESLVDLPADAGDALWSFVPRFRFALDDIGADGVAALRTRALSAFVRLTLHTLLEGRSTRAIDTLLASWADLIREAVREPHGPGALRPIFRYLHEVRKATDHAAIATTARELITDKEDLMETIADMFRNQGLQKGRQEGLQEGLREGLVVTLQARFGDLAPAVQARVDQADLPTLKRWTRQVHTVRSLDDLFHD